MLIFRGLAVFCITILSAVAHAIRPANITTGGEAGDEWNNFPNGRRNHYIKGDWITYFYLDHLAGRQTYLSDSLSEGLVLRELASGDRLVEMMYIQERLLSCDIGMRAGAEAVLRREAAATHHDRDRATVAAPSNNIINNSTATATAGAMVLGAGAAWLDFDAVTRQCSRHRRHQSGRKPRRRRSLYKSKPRRNSRYRTHKRRSHDLLAMGHKRTLRHNMITPGTNWCGPSNRAKKYADLGGFWATDKCCRRHDQCSMSIAPLSSKFSRVNTSPFTLSHCSCDKRFRTCLKMADTGASHLVGKLFFNILQTKCFTLKSEKVCTKRNWFGKCLKYEMKKQARMKDNLAF